MPRKRKEEGSPAGSETIPDFGREIGERFNSLEEMLRGLDSRIETKIEANAKVTSIAMKLEIERNLENWKKMVEDETRMKLDSAVKALERSFKDVLETELKSIGTKMEEKRETEGGEIAVGDIVVDIFEALRKNNKKVLEEIENKVRSNLATTEYNVPESGISRLMQDIRACMERDAENGFIVLNTLKERYKNVTKIDMKDIERTMELLSDKEQQLKMKDEEFAQVYRILNMQSDLLSKVFDIDKNIVLSALKKMGIAKDDLQSMLNV